MPDQGKNIVQLTDEQMAAFTMLFPTIAAQRINTVTVNKKKDRRKNANDYSGEIAAAWKKKYPFS